MKIIYLNPPYGKDFVRSARWAARSRGRVQRHPEQALVHVAVLEAAGHECSFVDGAAMNLTEEQVIEKVAQFNPDLTIVHTTTPSIYNDIEYARKAKALNNCITVLVGAHASALPEETLKAANGAADIIARDEVDFTLRDIANGLPWEQIAGITYLNGSTVKSNPARPFLDVNELPFPSWKHVDPHWYHDAGKRYPFVTLYSGRGCFGLCTFCRETSVINGRRLRMRDPKRVVDEMEYDLKLFPDLKEIMFETDTFTAVSKHVEGVCDEIMRRGLQKRVSWSCNVRVDINLDLLPKMKAAGCRMLMVGYEFGSNKQLNAVKKGTTIETAREFSRRAHDLGFTLHGCFMIGAPDETKESAQGTIDFACSLPLDTVQFSGIAVYPGTELYDWAQDNGFVIPKDWVDWVDENHEQVTLLNYPQFSKKEMDYYIDRGIKSFYLRPRQIFSMLTSLDSIDDLKRKAYGFSRFLDYFSKNKRDLD
jgi:anaerobic magnesium-protoporphyrin IX monomethyl ester cyclase